ncbi:MAG: CcmD family protein [Candidatus Dadabacteria bacterium]|nr:CcmD family protein [Candidatus Dadabacteria bacterium]
MEYLFWSQIIVWGCIFCYIIILIKKTKKLSKELDILKSNLESKDK